MPTQALTTTTHAFLTRWEWSGIDRRIAEAPSSVESVAA